MNKLIKNTFILILIVIFIMAFSSSYFSLSMDNLAYVLAIGIDKSDENKLKVSFQFSTASPVAESGSTEKAPSVIDTVEASSLSTAINLMNNYLSKQVNMSHCKVIIFSEELAKEGISSEIYTLINDTQVRPSSNIVITKTDANYYMQKTQPQLENLIAKYYETFTDSSEYTGFMPNATIGEFFNTLICKECEPFAILGGVIASNSQNDQDSGSSTNNAQRDYTIKSSHSPISGETDSENIGMAVFKGDTLVGELNALETLSFLSIRNEVNRFLVSIPDPTTPSSYLDIYLTPENMTEIKVDTKTGSPYIQVSLRFTGRIYSMENNENYLKPDVLETISASCDSYLESTFSDFLYKTAKEFHSDILGFGKSASSNFFTMEEFEDYNWLESYQDSYFDVSVDTSVKSSMLITETNS